MVKGIHASHTTDASNLVKKADYNTKIHRNHDQYITAQEYDKLTLDNFKSRLTESKLAIKMILLIS